MSNNSGSTSSSSGGIGFFGLLTIVFITLKLTGFIAWSWWWVFSPLFVAALLFFFVVFLVILAAWLNNE